MAIRWLRAPDESRSGARWSWVSWGLVATQGLLFAAIAFFPASWGPSMPRMWHAGLVIFALGALGSLAAVVNLGTGLTPLPEPNGSGLTARGVYRWVRHPMYTSVVVTLLGVAVARGAFASWVLVGVLALFFEFKTRREERFLVSAYEGYAAYASRTGKFIPGLGKRQKDQSPSAGISGAAATKYPRAEY